MQWRNEQDLYDTIPAKDIVPPPETERLDVVVGTKCQAQYEGAMYDVEIIARGELNKSSKTLFIFDSESNIMHTVFIRSPTLVNSICIYN